jgi:hypothetical protein
MINKKNLQYDSGRQEEETTKYQRLTNIVEAILLKIIP